MSYTLLRGEFVIRYPDLPRNGPQPDGDTVKLRLDNPALLETLPRISGAAPDANPRGINVRMEAIDALETHFERAHQHLGWATAARDELLRLLGFTNVVFFDDMPNNVRSADQDTVRGHVLTNGVDAFGRLIGFVFAGDHDAPDGSQVWLDEDLADRSANAMLLAAGLVYPAFYSSLPASLRKHLADASRTARDARSGLWADATADPNGAATVAGMPALEDLVVWPKLFRRLVRYLGAGHTDLDDLDRWLRDDPVDRDDTLFLLDRGEHGNMHDVVRGAGDQLQLLVWPEDFIITPDPARPGTTTTPAKTGTGDVLILAVLPDPLGEDRGNELVTLLNTTPAPIDLAGWGLVDAAGGRNDLTGTLAGGAAVQVAARGRLQLGNKGDTLVLVDGTGASVDHVTYKAKEVRPGRTICFGR